MILRTLSYSLCVWVTGAAVSPAIILLLNWLRNTNEAFNFQAYMIALVIGFAYSIPSFVIACLIVYLVKYKHLNAIIRMSILTISGILLTFLAMMLSSHGFRLSTDEVYWACVYSAVIIGGIFIYKAILADRAVLQPSV